MTFDYDNKQCRQDIPMPLAAGEADSIRCPETRLPGRQHCEVHDTPQSNIGDDATSTWFYDTAL